MEGLPLAQATVSQHLKALEAAGLIEGRRDGASVRYRLLRERLRSFCHSFQETLGTERGGLEGCQQSEPEKR